MTTGRHYIKTLQSPPRGATYCTCTILMWIKIPFWSQFIQINPLYIQHIQCHFNWESNPFRNKNNVLMINNDHKPTRFHMISLLYSQSKLTDSTADQTLPEPLGVGVTCPHAHFPHGEGQAGRGVWDLPMLELWVTDYRTHSPPLWEEWSKMRTAVSVQK